MRWTLVFLISLAFSLFLISPIVSTTLKTPPNTVNMMVGHYFEDYYEYLSFIKQGQKGSIILENLFDGQDRTKIIVPWWPYSLLGFLSSLPAPRLTWLHLDIPPQLIYWSSSAVFSFVLLLTTFIAVSTLLKGEKFLIQLLAFLLIIFSSGFFNIFDIFKSPFPKIVPYDFWYSIGPPFSRYNIGTPHHQLTQIIFLLGLLFCTNRIRSPLAFTTLSGYFLMSLLLLFLSPPQLLLFWISYLAATTIVIISNLKSPCLRRPRLTWRRQENYKSTITKSKVSILETDPIESQKSKVKSQKLDIPFLNFRTGDTIGGTPSKDAVPINRDEYLMEVNRGSLPAQAGTRKLESEEKSDTEALYDSEKLVSRQLCDGKENLVASKIERQDSQVSIASKLFLPFIITIILISPIAYLLQKFSLSSPTYISGKLWDITHLYYPGLSLFILTTGLLLLLAIFGLPLYFSKISFARLLFFFITFFSFLLVLIPFNIFSTNILTILGIHNLRFNTPHSYISLGIASILFLKIVFQKAKRVFVASCLILFYFSLSVFGFWQIHARNPYSAGFLQFLPSELYQGLKALEQQKDNSTTLASPSSLLGVIIPAISGKRVYIGRSIFTLNLEEKTAVATKFYTLKMTPDEAENFLKKEKIGSILLTSADINEKEFLDHYSFLQSWYKNNQLTIVRQRGN